MPERSDNSRGDVVAVIDIGSNSGRVMVFEREPSGHLRLLAGSRAGGEKVVRLMLSNPTNGAVLGPRSKAELIIPNGSGTAWLNFGLDQVEILQTTLFEIPLWQYLASLIYIFLAFYVSKLLDFLIRGRLRQWARKTSTGLDDLLLELLRGPIKVIVFVIPRARARSRAASIAATASASGAADFQARISH